MPDGRGRVYSAGNEMTTAEHAARPLRHWTPIRCFPEDDGRPVVEWCRLDDVRLTMPFFQQTVRSARARNCPLRRTPMAALTALAAMAPELPLSGLVFHLSRCGSTLVSQMLAALPAHVVVSEAEVLDEVLRSDRWSPPVTDEERIAWLRGLVHAYGAQRFPEERRLFLKLDPWHILDLDVIRAAFPGVPSIFLYRDPVEILVSQSDNFAGTLVPDAVALERVGLTLAELSRLTVEDYCARVLGRFAEAAADAAARDPDLRLVAYSQLPTAVETIIAPWFGLTLGLEDRERMRQASHFHAKAPGRLVFQDDTARKQRDADDELRALAEHRITPHYARLERIRLTR